MFNSIQRQYILQTYQKAVWACQENQQPIVQTYAPKWRQVQYAVWENFETASWKLLAHSKIIERPETLS